MKGGAVLSDFAVGTAAEVNPQSVVGNVSTTPSSIQSANDTKPKLQARTWMAIFAAGFVYYAQLLNLVNAGAVSGN